MRIEYPTSRSSGNDLRLDFSSELRCEVLPARMRGEKFDQKYRVTYSFKHNEIAANLVALQDIRTILIQVDVAKTRTPCSHPPLSKSALQFAERELTKLRQLFVGPRARIWRWIKRDLSSFDIEGPFLPLQPGAALLMMAIRVSREANFDSAYDRVRRHLELHRFNDDRDCFAKRWRPDRPKVEPKREFDPGYPWTVAEFDAIERMARLESPSGRPDEDAVLMPRRVAYNQGVLAKAQGVRVCENAMVSDTDAAEAANFALHDFFCSPLSE